MHGLAGSGALTAVAASQLASLGNRLAYVQGFDTVNIWALDLSGERRLPLCCLR